MNLAYINIILKSSTCVQNTWHAYIYIYEQQKKFHKLNKRTHEMKNE